MSSGRIAVQIRRIRLPGADSAASPSSPSELRQATVPAALDAAAAQLAEEFVDALGYASTSSSYAIGYEAEVRVVQRLRDRWGLPATSSGMAAVSAMRTFGTRRVAVIHPPWFDQEANELGAAYFRSQGFDAIASRAEALPTDPALVRSGPIVEWVTQHLDDQADAIFLGGNGFRAAEAVETLERRTGRLVLEANQVLLWSVLDATGISIDVSRYGGIFREGRHT